jgi:hypothetical protein
MAGSFIAPSASPKARTGKPNRPKRTDEDATGLSAQPRKYALTDSFASDKIPSFATRRKNTNNKTGFNVVPSRPPAGRLAERAPAPSRGSGKEHRAAH